MTMQIGNDDPNDQNPQDPAAQAVDDSKDMNQEGTSPQGVNRDLEQSVWAKLKGVDLNRTPQQSADQSPNAGVTGMDGGVKIQQVRQQQEQAVRDRRTGP